MKTPPYHRFLRPRWAGRSTLLLATTAVLAWLAPPLRADVIDDFEGPKKHRVFASSGEADYAVVDGQLKMSQTRGGAAGIYYLCDYAIPEGRSIEFRVDVVSANDATTYAGLQVVFDAGNNYGLFRYQNRVTLGKLWTDQTVSEATVYADQYPARFVGPVTMILSLAREGNRVRVRGKVVERDNPDRVIFDHWMTDTGTFGANGYKAPFMGPVTFVQILCSDLAGSSAVRDQLVIDNLVCSDDPLPPHMSIRRQNGNQATLEWPGRAILMEADSVQGPWKPCAEEIAEGPAACGSTMPLDGSDRFFRCVRGWHEDGFLAGDYPWQTASPVPGRVWRPAFAMVQGHGRIFGQGARNEEFLVGFHQVGGIWFRDCVVSVDILDWDETMVDAAFGILLRVKPDKEMWFPKTDGLPGQHYAGLLTFKTADDPAESALSILGPGDTRIGQDVRFPALNPDRQYRLRFSAVGRQLTLELFDLEEPTSPLKTCTATDARITEGMHALYGTRSANDTYNVTIDRFLLRGVMR